MAGLMYAVRVQVAFGRYAIAAHATGQWSLATSWAHRDICMKVRACRPPGRQGKDRGDCGIIARAGGLGRVHWETPGAALGVLRRGGQECHLCLACPRWTFLARSRPLFRRDWSEKRRAGVTGFCLEKDPEHPILMKESGSTFIENPF